MAIIILLAIQTRSYQASLPWDCFLDFWGIIIIIIIIIIE